jgi:dTMP kinase
LSEDEIRALSGWATDDLQADLTVLLDLPVADGLARARGRSAADRLERESLEFHERVRAAYLRFAADEPGRYLLLDATRPIDDLAAEVAASVQARLPVGTQ